MGGAAEVEVAAMVILEVEVAAVVMVKVVQNKSRCLIKYLMLNIEPHVLLLTQRHIGVADLFIVTRVGIAIRAD